MSNKKDPSIAIANAILQVSNLLGVFANHIIKDKHETKSRKAIAKMSKTVAKTAKKIAIKAKTPAKPKHQSKRPSKRQVIAIPSDSPLARIFTHMFYA